MPSLDDLYYFDVVVQHGGFAPASRALDIPKSKLSRRVAALEKRLDVRLLERSTRRFKLTPVGERFVVHCRAALEEARAAEEVALAAGAQPRGLVRLGCPPGFGEHALAKVLFPFFSSYPDVRLEIIVGTDPVDLIEERVDLVIRANPSAEGASDLISRRVGSVALVPVASPSFLESADGIACPQDIARHPTISYVKRVGQNDWILYDEAGASIDVRHQPRIISNDFSVLREAAIEGVGIAVLPQAICFDAIADGRLKVLLPDWHGGETEMYLLFTSRRGMLPAVRVLVDHLIAVLPDFLKRHRESLAATFPPAMAIRAISAVDTSAAPSSS